jgi:hypothetical protein
MIAGRIERSIPFLGNGVSSPLCDSTKPGTVPARWGGGMLAFFRRWRPIRRKIERFEGLCPVVKAPFAPLATSSTGGGAALTSG